VVDLTKGINLDYKNPDGASSRHSRGVFALFADGKVRFLPNDIDKDTLRALSTMAGCEEVDADAY
jgi:hypothetical protein